MRGTFANIRLRNRLAPGDPLPEGGVTQYLGRRLQHREETSIYDASMRYIEQHVPLIILAGKEYGSGSSRDWAAKGTRLLGVRAVIAEGFERIHRSNLVGMGVLPLQFKAGEHCRVARPPPGQETFNIAGIAGDDDDPARAGRDRRRQGVHCHRANRHPQASRRTTATAGSFSTFCASCWRPERENPAEWLLLELLDALLRVPGPVRQGGAHRGRVLARALRGSRSRPRSMSTSTAPPGARCPRDGHRAVRAGTSAHPSWPPRSSATSTRSASTSRTSTTRASSASGRLAAGISIQLVGQRILLDTLGGEPVRGVIGRKAIHQLDQDERKQAPELKALHIDVGAASGDEAHELVRVGDMGVIDVSAARAPQ